MLISSAQLMICFMWMQDMKPDTVLPGLGGYLPAQATK